MASVLRLVITLNVIAAAFMYQRAAKMGMVPNVEQLTDQFRTLIGKSPFQKLPPAPYRLCGHLNSSTFIIKSRRVVIEQGVRPAAIVVVDGLIKSIEDFTYHTDGIPLLDFSDAVLSPGVIDVHGHFNEPGREHWEGVSSGSAAAAVGGITTVIDMPLNSDPCTTTPELLAAKMAVGRAKSHVNVGYWGGIVPDNSHQWKVLSDMVDGGALGFKSFMSPSGINDFPNIDEEHVGHAIAFCKLKGVPFLVHAEIVSPLDPSEGDPRKYSTWLEMRPAGFERDAIQMLIHVLADDKRPTRPGFSVHVVHLGDAGSLPMLQIAQRHKLPISAETCPHYLSFSAEDIPDGATQFKCAPPIRDADNRGRLIAAALNGSISIISSDHSPAPPEMKEFESGDFLKAWGGISAMQYLLPATWTALSAHGGSLVRLSSLLSSSPARLAGLDASKGSIAVGKDADLVAWDPAKATDTSTESNRHRHKLGPFKDAALKGSVLATLVRGNLVYSAEAGLHPDVCGQVVTRPVVRQL